MKTLVIKVPDKDEELFLALLKRFGFKSHLLSEDEKEDAALAKWIHEGLKSEEVSEETILATLKKNGVKV